MTSPSAFLLAGGGAAVAILAGAPLAAAAVVGGIAYLARVVLAIPRAGRTRERIDPRSLGNPWRAMVVDAQQSRARFEQTIARTRPGPLRERLRDLGRRLDDAVLECWRIACHGNNLEGALRQLDTKSVQLELAQAEAEAKAAGRTTSASLKRTIEALRAQLSSAERISSVWQGARDRLRLLNAQLDEAVARAIELSVGSGDANELNPLASDVDTLVGDLEALRQALETTEDATGDVPLRRTSRPGS